ncbi:MAG: penicillin acylase family protein, partial [Myxococcota bacterium]|nr:penicillin acylase family protein [Myxococcota bacterium]
MTNCRITYDRHGTPGIWAANVREAYWGIGWVHGRHRPVQSLLLGAAARGSLSGGLLARDDLVGIDMLMHRIGVPEVGKAEADHLSVDGAAWVDAYLAGFTAGHAQGGQAAEFRLLMAKLPPLNRHSVISGLMLSGFLGLAEGQERMERAIIAAVAEGADPQLLEMMFSPFLAGWNPDGLTEFGARQLPGFGANRLVASGGSNAWAIGGERCHSAQSILCGDPHLQVNQLPALFCEIRVRLPDNYWLGATIPGLPGIAVGR